MRTNAFFGSILVLGIFISFPLKAETSHLSSKENQDGRAVFSGTSTKRICLEDICEGQSVIDKNNYVGQVLKIQNGLLYVLYPGYSKAYPKKVSELSPEVKTLGDLAPGKWVLHRKADAKVARVFKNGKAMIHYALTSNFRKDPDMVDEESYKIVRDTELLPEVNSFQGIKKGDFLTEKWLSSLFSLESSRQDVEVLRVYPDGTLKVCFTGTLNPCERFVIRNAANLTK